jgi:hypothetical protein
MDEAYERLLVRCQAAWEVTDRVSDRLSAMEGNLRSILNHWNEFGPEHGFAETIDRVERWLKMVEATAVR